MTTAPDRTAEHAADAWQSMFDFLMRSAPQRLQSLQEHGLTPNDSRALFSLNREGRPIGALAREWGCDPSTATWLVDRLERAGLAERAASSTDRRVKLVRVTEKGTRTVADLMAAYHRPPPQMAKLSAQELDALIRIFARLNANSP
ncbi:MAG: MarR family winged helix-turn-helix transcriptional regulator [Phyllobacterium sp.]